MKFAPYKLLLEGVILQPVGTREAVINNTFNVHIYRLALLEYVFLNA